MALIIDGYNLLHASGILGRGLGPGGLERSRRALLDFLAESLEADELPRTTIVFDAGNSPRGSPRAQSHRGLRVCFASGKADADELIEELIKADSAPRRLTVVSSDHRLHRAARRRRATAVDSDKWHASVVQRRLARRDSADDQPPKPAGPLSPYEVAFWLQHFSAAPAASDDALADEVNDLESDASLFPPGYGEDIGESET